MLYAHHFVFIFVKYNNMLYWCNIADLYRSATQPGLFGGISRFLLRRVRTLRKLRCRKKTNPSHLGNAASYAGHVGTLTSEQMLAPLTPVHTTPEEFENAALFLWLGLPSTLIRHENAALFLRLGLPSTLIRHENGAFRKRPSNRRNLKTPTLCFSVDRKHFENGAFRKRSWHHDNNVISLTEVSLTTNSKWPVIVAFLNSSGVVWTENIWCVFRVKALFSNSHGVVLDGA